MLCRYMGISSDAELEEIKSAYRRLSKQYHPDSTQLPLEIAAQKFMRLKVRLFHMLYIGIIAFTIESFQEVMITLKVIFWSRINLNNLGTSILHSSIRNK